MISLLQSDWEEGKKSSSVIINITHSAPSTLNSWSSNHNIFLNATLGCVNLFLTIFLKSAPDAYSSLLNVVMKLIWLFWGWCCWWHLPLYPHHRLVLTSSHLLYHHNLHLHYYNMTKAYEFNWRRDVPECLTKGGLFDRWEEVCLTSCSELMIWWND